MPTTYFTPDDLTGFADSVRTVTLRSFDAQGGYADHSASGLPRAVAAKQLSMAGGDGYSASTVWHLEAAPGLPVPATGDEIRESPTGPFWYVDIVELQTFRKRYRLTCRGVA